MQITLDRIEALCPDAAIAMAGPIAHALDDNAANFGIDTLDRRACLMAQLAVESGDFNHLEENLNYTHASAIDAVFPHLAPRADSLLRNPPALANAAYAGRDGNGDEASGDGWRFRGRGLIQITGRANYRAAGAGIGIDLVGNPDLARCAGVAAKVALWFWRDRSCSALADTLDVTSITRLINGPREEALQRRKDLTTRALAIFA